MQPFPLIDRVDSNYAPIQAVPNHKARRHDPRAAYLPYSITPLTANDKRNWANFGMFRRISASERENAAKDGFGLGLWIPARFTAGAGMTIG